MVKRKKSPLEVQYMKERRRLQQALYRARKQGYIFDDDILPKIPKKITPASVKRLGHITPQKLKNKGRFVIKETGEILTTKSKRNKKQIREDIKQQNKRKREIDSSLKSHKGGKFNLKSNNDVMEYFDFNTSIVMNFKSYISTFPEGIAVPLLDLVNTLIKEEGIESVSESLQNMPKEFHEYLNQHGHDSQAAVSDFASNLINYLPDVSIQYKKDMMDRFEFNEIGYTVED